MSRRGPQQPPTHSIVEYFYPPESEGHRCGYCKSSNTNYSHGMWAHMISPENYENLINTGWRRSGCYIYKPMNDKICCPMYTIRNQSTKVEISRSQRKVLKRFKKYLLDGVEGKKGSGGDEGDTKKKFARDDDDEDETMNDMFITEDKRDGSDSNKVSIADEPKVEAPVKNCDQTSRKEPEPEPMQSTSSLPATKKSHPLKKKFLRRERKRQKLLAKGLDPDEFFRRNEKNRIKELESFFKDNHQSAKLQFSTKLVQVDSVEFHEKYFEMEHKLYEKYQMAVHGDDQHDCRQSQFKRFLCDNPFTGEYMEAKPTEASFPQLGTHHQHYYIASTLVAVGVVDILPHCVSSVYFFYDPDYSFLSPGTLGALQEIHFVNELNKINPRMEYYYLGFYIHSCVKMRYKSKFRPCQLVCPAKLEWVDFGERVKNILDRVGGGFARLKEGQDDDANCDINELLQKVLLLYNRRIFAFNAYIHKDSDREELISYAKLVGPVVASNMLLYRTSSRGAPSSN